MGEILEFYGHVILLPSFVDVQLASLSQKARFSQQLLVQRVASLRNGSYWKKCLIEQIVNFLNGDLPQNRFYLNFKKVNPDLVMLAIRERFGN